MAPVSMRVSPLPSWIIDEPFAHRGLHDEAAGIPENTLAAFDAAIASGYAIELDVRQMGDGALVVFHDSNLRRACGIDGRLSDLAWGDVKQTGIFGTEHQMPLFDEVLALTAGRVPLLVEVKKDSGHHDIERALHDTLSRYHGPFAVQSFSPTALRWFRKHAIGAALGLVAGPLTGEDIPALKKFSSRSLLGALVSRPDFINYDLRAMPDAWIGVISRLASLPVICWTVRTDEDKQKAERLGLNYVFENVRP
ncbi:MAG: glycerophosphodiester phosphodiesterase family protein [Polyangiales bacterium]